MPGQQPIHGGVWDGTAQSGLIARFDAARGDQLSGLGFLSQGCQHRLFLRHRQILMAATAFGPALGARQPAPQIVRPDAPDMAHAQARGLGDDFGGPILLGPQPKTLQPLKSGFVGGGQHGATNRTHLARRNLGSRTHKFLQPTLVLY